MIEIRGEIMLYPSFLEENDVIGITACSCGVLEKIEKFSKSVAILEKYGFQVRETDNVRTGGLVSSSSKVRARELESLFLQDDVKMVAIARGGDFLYEMIDQVDFNLLVSHPKWLVGSSDPTSLLYILTTAYDIATIYSPCNMTGLDVFPLHLSYVNYLKLLKGDLVKQYRYEKYEGKPFSDVLDTDNGWINLNGDVYEEGMLIGGCIEVLKDLIGTPYDYTKAFIEKYKDEGFIWYFDVFHMTGEVLYNTLLQFKYAGWFRYTKAILFGKVCFPHTFVDMSYEELIKKVFPDMSIVCHFDLGHVKPSFTMINGAKVRVVSNAKEGSLEYLM